MLRKLMKILVDNLAYARAGKIIKRKQRKKRKKEKQEKGKHKAKIPY